MSATVPADILRLIAEQAGINESHVQPGSRLDEDLGLDSLYQLELLMHAEEERELDIDDRELESCTTVADFVALVERSRKL